jgi:phenylalanine-specific permease
VPTWIWAAAFFIIINAVNLVNVRLYGEAEFWFALIKVLAIIGMIGFGLWMLFGGHGGSKAGFDNLWKHGGFFATGWHGDVAGGDYVLLRRAGAYWHYRRRSAKPGKEHSESGQPGGVPYLLFYIGSLVVLLALYPWVEIKSDSSPFVMIFHNLDSNVVASALNFVILVASLSVYNSGVYSNSHAVRSVGAGQCAEVSRPRQQTRRAGEFAAALRGYHLAGGAAELSAAAESAGPADGAGGGDAAAELDHDLPGAPEVPRRPASQGRESKFKALLAPAGNYLCIAFLG